MTIGYLILQATEPFPRNM